MKPALQVVLSHVLVPHREPTSALSRMTDSDVSRVLGLV